MSAISFEWDHRKATSNRKKHGVSFAEAASAFYDEAAIVIDDPDNSENEDRFILLGMSRGLRVLVVCHCYRRDDAVIRIISARKANKSEREDYARRGEP
jgi:uncharacterized protein